MLPHFYRSFGGDHVQNLSRILRPPGTVNCKDARNGRLIAAVHASVVPAGTPLPRGGVFSLDRAGQTGSATRPDCALPVRCLARRRGRISARDAEVAEIVQHLDKPSRDRSRRDFAVVCDLLRLGLTGEEIWPLVAGSSKFESNGRPYFDVTIANAERKRS